jgi:hypothetical protein
MVSLSASMSMSEVVDCSASTDDDDGMDGYTYDELVRLHDQMTRQVHHITVEGLVEFRVNQHKGRIEVLVDDPYDHDALNALVAGSRTTPTRSWRRPVPAKVPRPVLLACSGG